MGKLGQEPVKNQALTDSRNGNYRTCCARQSSEDSVLCTCWEGNRSLGLKKETSEGGDFRQKATEVSNNWVSLSASKGFLFMEKPRGCHSPPDKDQKNVLIENYFSRAKTIMSFNTQRG